MENTKSIVVTLLLVVLFALAASNSALADEWNKATKLTFSEPVEVPGMALPAGTYWFTLADSDSDRNIVEVWDADRMHLITTILAIPDYRLQPTDKTVISFSERPTGSPEAVHAWFYPGDNYGEEFVYPKTRATQLAQQTNQPVLSMRDEQASDVAQIKTAPVKAVAPSGEEVELTEVVATQVVAPQEATQSSLPQTGSNLPLLALIGALALAGAGAFRIAARHIA
jgi:LPXTG-motif cell wall-anchored protein